VVVSMLFFESYLFLVGNIKIPQNIYGTPSAMQLENNWFVFVRMIVIKKWKLGMLLLCLAELLTFFEENSKCQQGQTAP